MTFDIRECSYFNAAKQKFLTFIEKTDTCWLWKQKKRSDGYGQLFMGGQWYKAHRLAYMLFNGPIPQDKIVRHTCDNSICVNPEHLVLGTYADNANDASKRQPGKQHKLNSEAVKVIKWMLKYRPQRGLSTKLARLHKVHPKTIQNIEKGKSWYWIEV